MAFEGRREVQQPGLEADRARVGDTLHEKVARILGRVGRTPALGRVPSAASDSQLDSAL